MILEASTKALIQDKKNPMFLKPMHERETAHVAKTRTRCIDDLTKSRTQFESRHNAVAGIKSEWAPPSKSVSTFAGPQVERGCSGESERRSLK